MNITLDGREIDIPRGNYGDKDDMLCRGCGKEIGVWNSHTVVDCLQVLREAIIELQKTTLLKKKVKVVLYGREDIDEDVKVESKPKTINKRKKKGK